MADQNIMFIPSNYNAQHGKMYEMNDGLEISGAIASET